MSELTQNRTKAVLDDASYAATRAAAMDDEVAGLIELSRRHAVPVLAAAGWVLRWPGADGIGCADHVRKGMRLIHSIARELDGDVWAHLSVSRRDRKLPTWEQTRDVYWLIYDQVPGVIVVAPRTEHVDLGEVAHVWANLSRPAVPDFTRGFGTI